MKRTIKCMVVLTGALVLAAGVAQASLDIPDGNSVGVASTINVSGMAGTIGSSLVLTLDISGCNNGDLYAYLSYDGTVVTLLNRPGTSPGNPLGFTDAGYNVTVQDSGANPLNTATGSSPVTGTYNAGSSSAFQTAYGSDDGNGTWTLFIADLSGGDGSDSQLNNWLLTINGTTVPEPITSALIVFAAGALSFALVRRLRFNKKQAL